MANSLQRYRIGMSTTASVLRGGTPFSHRWKTLIKPQSPTPTHHWPSRLQAKCRIVKCLYFGISMTLCALIERNGSHRPRSRTCSFVFLSLFFVAFDDAALTAEEAFDTELSSRTCRGKPFGISCWESSSPVPDCSRRWRSQKNALLFSLPATRTGWRPSSWNKEKRM